MVNRILVILLFSEYLKNFDEDLEMVSLPDATVKDLKENLYFVLTSGEELIEEVTEILEDYHRDEEENESKCKTEDDLHLHSSKLHPDIKANAKIMKTTGLKLICL